MYIVLFLPAKLGPNIQPIPTTVLLIPCVRPCVFRLVILDNNEIDVNTINGRLNKFRMTEENNICFKSLLEKKLISNIFLMYFSIEDLLLMR